MAVCTCTSTLSNIGIGGCAPTQDVAYSLIFVKLRDGSGNLNRIDLSSIPDASGISDLINEADPTKRWYPTPELKNVEDVRADSEFENFNDGTKAKIRLGIRSFSGFVVSQDSRFYEKVLPFQCQKEFGAYVVDVNGALHGDASVDGYLAPAPIQASSMDNIYVKATDTTVSKVNIRFDWKNTFGDENLGMLVASDFASDVDLTSLNGLLSVTGTASAITTTGFTMAITDYYGSVLGTPVKGLVAADFSLYNATDAASVTISTVTESPEGTYAFTFSAEDSSDVLNLSIVADGYDDAALEAVDITVP